MTAPTLTGTPDGAQSVRACARLRCSAATWVSEVMSGGEMGDDVADFAKRVRNRQHSELWDAFQKLAREARVRHALVHGLAEQRRLRRVGHALERLERLQHLGDVAPTERTSARARA